MIYLILGLVAWVTSAALVVAFVRAATMTPTPKPCPDTPEQIDTLVHNA